MIMETLYPKTTGQNQPQSCQPEGVRWAKWPHLVVFRDFLITCVLRKKDELIQCLCSVCASAGVLRVEVDFQLHIFRVLRLGKV